MGIVVLKEIRARQIVALEEIRARQIVVLEEIRARQIVLYLSVQVKHFRASQINMDPFDKSCPVCANVLTMTNQIHLL